MLTFNFVFNIFLMTASAVWLVLLPLTLRRIANKCSKRTFLAVACSSVNAVLWLLSVWLPFQRHGTLNTPHNDALFWIGIAATFLPDLISRWKARTANAR